MDIDKALSDFDWDSFYHFTFTDPSWWVVALWIIVPICIFLFIREVCCWFWKFNRMVAVLERMETRLKNVEQVIITSENVVQSVDEKSSNPHSSPQQTGHWRLK